MVSVVDAQGRGSGVAGAFLLRGRREVAGAKPTRAEITAASPRSAVAGGSRKAHNYRMATVDEIVVLRIELQGIEPLIWRRVAVRAGLNLTEVHRVIQAAMGWLDCHLWEFEANGRRYAMRLPSDPDWNERYEDAEAAALGSLFHSGERRLNYVYDMGDFWEHSVIIERSAAPLPSTTYPQFLGGERRCPPEDCGGVPGYYEFLKNIARKKTRKGALDWYGGPYDPDDIGGQEIAVALGRIAEAKTE